MQKGYYVYSGFEDVTEPVACFTLLEHAQKLSVLIGSNKPPSEFFGENTTRIDEYLFEMLRGELPWYISLLGDGTVFEINNGLLDGRITLSETVYFSEGDGAFSGTFWAKTLEEAVIQAKMYLSTLKKEN